MNDSISLLIADDKFIRRPQTKSLNLVSVYPSASDDSAYQCSYEELLNRAILQSAFYKDMLPVLISALNNYTKISDSTLEIIFRPILVHLTSLYIDRAIRVAHRVDQYHLDKLGFVKVISMNRFDGFDQLRGIEASSWQFNQSLIARIAEALGVKEEYEMSSAEFSEPIERPNQKNLLFNPEPKNLMRKTIQRIEVCYLNWIRKIPSPFAICSSAGFPGEDYWLTKAGFYGPFGIFNLQKRFKWADVEQKHVMRDALKTELLRLFAIPISDLLLNVSNGRISLLKRNELGKSFASYFVDYIPLRYLEGLDLNFKFALQDRLNKSNNLIVGADLMTDSTIFFRAAANELGGKSIGYQHGGHYGYIEGHSAFAELEYSLDKMITWGWSDFDAGLPSTEVICLPSPRLSCAPIGSSISLHSSNNAKKNILFMPNFMRRFSPVGTCGQTRPDFNNQILSSQKRLIEFLAKSDLSVDLKPMHDRIIDLFPDHFAELEDISKDHYHLLESRQKGLSRDLVQNYQLLLWDQIGTGTLDCFVQQIPCMIYWERMYSRELSSVKSTIAGLEKVGVVHASLPGLVKEILIMLDDPLAWMNDENRIKAIDCFCYNFSRKDKNLPVLWRRAFKELHKSTN